MNCRSRSARGGKQTLVLAIILWLALQVCHLRNLNPQIFRFIQLNPVINERLHCYLIILIQRGKMHENTVAVAAIILMLRSTHTSQIIHRRHNSTTATSLILRGMRCLRSRDRRARAGNKGTFRVDEPSTEFLCCQALQIAIGFKLILPQISETLFFFCLFFFFIPYFES